MIGFSSCREENVADKDQLILTAIGPDQVGLVQRISSFVARAGCNIEDSKMAVFCGEFAVILLISGNSESFAHVTRDAAKIEKETGLTIAVKTPPARKPASAFRPYRLTASAMDHPGIVYKISGVLSELGVNIESMETQTYPAPESGAPLFRLDAEIAVPARVNIAELRDLFANIQESENIDIELHAGS